MRKLFSKIKYFYFTAIVFFVAVSNFSKFDSSYKKISDVNSMYSQLQLSSIGLKPDIFAAAIEGWKTLFEKQLIVKSNLLSIADLSQPSDSKRLYVIDMSEKKVLFNTYVAHGRNSGDNFATSFSNKPNSFKSSLGFYITENTYEGQHGLSMKLKGLEKGINDSAEQRGIVMHGATYVSESFINSSGRIGRSEGCPAVPEELCNPIINSIKDGSCFFMYYPDSSYFNKSVLL